MATFIFVDEAGREQYRTTGEQQPEMFELGVGDRIGDGRGGKVRLVAQTVDGSADETVVTWTVVPWTED